MLKHRLPSPPIKAATPETIDFYIEELSQAILKAITKSTSKTVASGKATPDFDDKCKKAQNGTNWTRRNFQKLLTKDNDTTNKSPTK